MRTIDSRMLIMLEHYSLPIVKKSLLFTIEADKVVELDDKALTDLMVEISLDLQLLKHITAENIIAAFEKLRRRRNDPMEIVVHFRLLRKIQDNGLLGEDFVYRNINTKTKDWIKDDKFRYTLK
jgi:hypothetical protein